MMGGKGRKVMDCKVVYPDNEDWNIDWEKIE